ncbi:MAG: ABC transporter ATP-binding protein [Candidatus Bathycorpusculaceae bacterium]
MLAVEMQSICKEYSGKQVLKDVSFKVQNGEIFVLVGPNGAGKTTLLRILDLLEPPTSGRVLFDGKSIDYFSRDKAALRRRIGMVFQQTVLFNMSVFDNVKYGLRVRGREREEADRMVEAVIELVQLRGLEHKNALALSGGEAQRVALAQALVTEPELLLLDEPTANLDPRNVSIVEEALLRVNREKKTTTIMATHNMFQAENLAHRVAVINEGRTEKIGTFQEVFEAPSKFLVDFARLENVFSGISKVTDDGTSLIDIGDGKHVEAAFKKSGNVTFYVKPEEIIVSSHPLVSSARNTFEGRIVQVSDLGSVVKLKVRAGKDFVVQITKRSFNEMQLNVDSKVFLVFKASSVQRV